MSNKHFFESLKCPRCSSNFIFEDGHGFNVDKLTLFMDEMVFYGTLRCSNLDSKIEVFQHKSRLTNLPPKVYYIYDFYKLTKLTNNDARCCFSIDIENYEVFSTFFIESLAIKINVSDNRGLNFDKNAFLSNQNLKKLYEEFENLKQNLHLF